MNFNLENLEIEDKAIDRELDREMRLEKERERIQYLLDLQIKRIELETKNEFHLQKLFSGTHKEILAAADLSLRNVLLDYKDDVATVEFLQNIVKVFDAIRVKEDDRDKEHVEDID